MSEYGPEKTPYLDTFHALITYKVVRNIQTMTNQCLSDVHSRTCILQYFFNNVIPCQSITNILIWNYVREQLLKELRNCILTARRVIIILFNAAFSRSAVSTIFFGKLALIVFQCLSFCFLLVRFFELNATICWVIIYINCIITVSKNYTFREILSIFEKNVFIKKNVEQSPEETAV